MPFSLQLQKSKSDYLFGSGNQKDVISDKTPNKPKRITAPSEPNKFFLQKITKKMSVSMPELLDESIVKKSTDGWNNNIESNLSRQKKNNSVERLQVCFSIFYFCTNIFIKMYKKRR